MAYTYDEYEAFYIISKLRPYIETKSQYRNRLYELNQMQNKGILIAHDEKEFSKNKEKYLQKVYPALVKALDTQGALYLQQPITPQRENINYLAKVFNLTPEETQILTLHNTELNNKFLKRAEREMGVSNICEGAEEIETILGLARGGCFKFLNRQAPLFKLGILNKRPFNDDSLMSYWAVDFINSVFKNEADRYRALLGSPLALEGTLSAKDFSYIDGADLLVRVFKNAKQKKGINLLLYGAPGTGKTSFAKMLANLTKRDMYSVGVCSEGEPEKNYRLRKLYRQAYMLKNQKKACLLFDEGEDIFSSIETHVSKVELNNLLENNDVPVIWTTNRIQRMDPAFIRRFTLAVCFTQPPIEVRQKIWNKYLTENKITHEQGDALALAKKYEIAPSMIASATQTSHLVKGNLQTVTAHIDLMRQAMNGGYKKPKEEQQNQNFYPELIHADMDLNALTEQLKGLGRLNFSLCLYGASGTGKSAYARYLANQLGLDVLHRRSSDLMSAYVGETEHNIARAFATAKENKSMLIFDEADSFLRDRSTALRSWEVSSVNEMLTWMESHPYPFICTTNLMDTIDSASLRRFSFKVKYDFLTPQQVVCAFASFFRVMIAESDVEELTKLTPGDFTLVKNKAEILGKENDFYALKQMLLDEQRLKQNRTGSGIGFHIN